MRLPAVLSTAPRRPQHSADCPEYTARIMCCVRTPVKRHPALSDHGHGMWDIRTAEQLLSDPRPVLAAIGHQVVDGHPVDARSPTVAHHARVCGDEILPCTTCSMRVRASSPPRSPCAVSVWRAEPVPPPVPRVTFGVRERVSALVAASLSDIERQGADGSPCSALHGCAPATMALSSRSPEDLHLQVTFRIAFAIGYQRQSRRYAPCLAHTKQRGRPEGRPLRNILVLFAPSRPSWLSG
jgi:hypothetical protein